MDQMLGMFESCGSFEETELRKSFIFHLIFTEVHTASLKYLNFSPADPTRLPSLHKLVTQIYWLHK